MVVKGAKNQAIGPSRGGQTTKIHVLTDVIGRPFAFKLTGGNAADSPIAPALLNSLKGARYLPVNFSVGIYREQAGQRRPQQP